MNTIRSIQDTVKLRNGVKMPGFGFGTMPATRGTAPAANFIKTVKTAINAGYRNIDTATAYNNEKEVGEAMRQSISEGDIKREQLFISTKLWNTHRGYDLTLEAFDTSMERLGLDYLDLYLIHVPAVELLDKNWQQTNHSTWRAFEQLYKEGRIKAIGVSNFLPHHLQALMDTAEVMPMVNQIEVHPGFNSAETIDFCRNHNIAVEAWGPFGNGQVLTNEHLQTIADSYRKSVAQICLRWLIQKGIVPLPKSYNKERIIENTRIFDFELTDTDMNIIDNITDCGGFCVNPDTASAD